MIFKTHSFFMFLLGIIGGIFFPHYLKFGLQLYYENCREKRSLERITSIISIERVEKPKLKKKKFIFIGVMTAEKYLDSRARAVYETWGSDLKGYGKLMFFASSQIKDSDLPVVFLDGVDDSYPPQKKSMMMLKYMHDNYINEYEWFVRGDDDVYIRIDKLQNFLLTLNSSDDLYIGQTGRYKETLRFGIKENYCMGGPSFVFTSSALYKLIPYVKYCLEHLKTKHEDVEVGRCLKNFVGISCTWALEMESLFYHNRAGNNALIKLIKTNAFYNAITIHPVKKSPYMKILHLHFLELKVKEYTQETLLLQRQLKTLDTVLSKDFFNLSSDEMVSLNNVKNFYNQMPKNEEPEWEMFTSNNVYSCDKTKKTLSGPYKQSTNEVLRQMMIIFNKEARQRLQQMLVFKRLNYGYHRHHPKYGAQYKLNILMNYHAPLGLNNQKLNIHIERHVYLQRPFGNTIYSIDHIKNALKGVLHFILPLDGQFASFVNFMLLYEKLCLQRRLDTSLTVVYFSKVTASKNHMQYFTSIKVKYPHSILHWIELNVSFSRSLGLSTGALSCNKSALLVFLDVEVKFTEDFLIRCKTNTKLGEQVYYPMVAILANQLPLFQNAFKASSKFNGFWSSNHYKVSCQYRADFDQVGGFNTSVSEEENKDADLYERYLINGPSVFRAFDPGLFQTHE
ncbi:chondroitin sulfate synthase 1 isoform X2 [Hydra vulgaris]|uniref:Hexosyltransferase n=1 Tax=Hydra vulgaris TaxID=6087 RepID=A0ABM4D9I7_HYDVU